MPEPHVQQAIASLQAEMRTCFVDLDARLQQLTMQVGSGMDSMSVSLHTLRTEFQSQATLAFASHHTAQGRNGRTAEKGGGTQVCSAQTRSIPEDAGGADADAFSNYSMPSDNTMIAADRRPSTGGASTLMSSMGSMFFVRQPHRNAYAQRLWTLLEDPDSSVVARWYSRVWGPIIVASVIATLLQTTQPPVLQGEVALAIGLVFDSLFMLEVLLRFALSPSTCIFIRNPSNVIDVLAALPLVIRAPCLAELWECGVDTATLLALLCVVPVLRLLKMLRHFQQFHLFVNLLSDTREVLSVLLFTLCILVFTFSSLIFLVESRDTIESLPSAMYMVIVTISTVGYGDLTPESTAGTCIVSACILCSVLYMALPIGIIGNSFTQIWADRDRILLMIRTRDRLMQWGYTAADMQMMFTHFDKNGDGELNLSEFRKMIAEMRIGILDDRVVDLFESFDKDGSGGIELKEFTRALFPSTYHELFGDKRRELGDEDGQEDQQTPRENPRSLIDRITGRTPSKERASNKDQAQRSAEAARAASDGSGDRC